MGAAIKKPEARCEHGPRVAGDVVGKCHCDEFAGELPAEPTVRTYAERLTRFVEDLVAHGASITTDKVVPSLKKTTAMIEARAKAIANARRR
jgi:hypothetical protein